MLSVRNTLINSISDDYKDRWGFRPRMRYDEMSLVDLKMIADQVRAELDDYYEEQIALGWGDLNDDLYPSQHDYDADQAPWNDIDDLYERNNW